MLRNRDLVIVLIASVVLPAEPDDRVRPVLVPQQQFVVLTLVHLGLVPVRGVPILERDNTQHGYVTLHPYCWATTKTSCKPLESIS